MYDHNRDMRNTRIMLGIMAVICLAISAGAFWDAFH